MVKKPTYEELAHRVKTLEKIILTNEEAALLEKSKDMTKIKEAQDKLIESEARFHQVQKLETIGTLAGGIAHDFNNILFPVIVLTELLLEKDFPDKIKEDLNSILKAGMRARGLVSQILTFSQKTKNKPEQIELHPLVKEIIKLSRSTLPSNIKINQRINSDCGYAMIDVVQFQQVVMNLISNAFHAMENSGGILSLSLFNKEKPSKDGHIKKYICLKIEDTGVGMNKETREKIFEPYFSTKEQNKGSGLGLAITHSIIHSFGGEIGVESEVDKGSSFCVCLPSVDKEIKKISPKNVKMINGHQKNILIVDDETMITELLERILERSGFKTDAFNDSLKAFEFFKQSPEKFHLIISDLTMPDMTGDVFCQEILKIRSDIPIILMTGYKENPAIEKQKEYGIDKILIKPLKKKEILSAISEMIK